MKRAVFIIGLTTVSIAQVYACRCFPSYSTKTYQEIKDTWYGKKVSYSCDYECVSEKMNETIEGFHSVRIIGSEKGNEIICDGTIYKEYYSSSNNWFRWVYKDSEWFNPSSSKSQTLKDWAKSNCR